MTDSTSIESIITVTIRSHLVTVVTNGVVVFVDLTSVKTSAVGAKVILPVGEAFIVILDLVLDIGLATVAL